MLQNRMFSFDFPCEENKPLKVSHDDNSLLWHVGYGHLNIRGLKFLYNK